MVYVYNGIIAQNAYRIMKTHKKKKKKKKYDQTTLTT